MVLQMSGAKMHRSYHDFFSEAQLVSWNPMIVSLLFIYLCCFISSDFRFVANLDSRSKQWHVDYDLVFHYAESFLPCKVA
ncbi:hypothetical protein R3W88_003973 [Solanum pinnatisectum]|uniref:Uncharacterized protein n=1 Tax=Solanum pinnatisectum TaxID=50273 RepID=A0AAV9MQQ4_9SOLN|nr:hypothetical protein R3W88_003973 [Solanum pinnatisectum]